MRSYALSMEEMMQLPVGMHLSRYGCIVFTYDAFVPVDLGPYLDAAIERSQAAEFIEQHAREINRSRFSPDILRYWMQQAQAKRTPST